MSFFRPRFARLRQRWRAKPTEQTRTWMRRQWPLVALTALAVGGIIVFDAWLGTCGFYGCPSTSEIRTFQPSEGGRSGVGRRTSGCGLRAAGCGLRAATRSPSFIGTLLALAGFRPNE
jgi:hypothetical protein